MNGRTFFKNPCKRGEKASTMWSLMAWSDCALYTISVGMSLRIPDRLLQADKTKANVDSVAVIVFAFDVSLYRT